MQQHVEDGRGVVTCGVGESDADGVRHSFRFADWFTFRDGLIAAVVSYVVPT